MFYKVDQFGAIHERKEGELYVDWNMVRAIALKWDGSANSRDALAGQLAQALLDKERRIEDLEKDNEQLTKACKEWSEVSQQNYQRAKAAQAELEEHKRGAMEAIKLVGQSARNAGLWQGKAEGLAIILTECVNDLEQAINGEVHKEGMEKLIDHARQVVDNLHKQGDTNV
jgi:hypothetical protein